MCGGGGGGGGGMDKRVLHLWWGAANFVASLAQYWRVWGGGVDKLTMSKLYSRGKHPVRVIALVL